MTFEIICNYSVGGQAGLKALADTAHRFALRRGVDVRGPVLRMFTERRFNRKFSRVLSNPSVQLVLVSELDFSNCI